MVQLVAHGFLCFRNILVILYYLFCRNCSIGFLFLFQVLILYIFLISLSLVNLWKQIEESSVLWRKTVINHEHQIGHPSLRWCLATSFLNFTYICFNKFFIRDRSNPAYHQSVIPKLIKKSHPKNLSDYSWVECGSLNIYSRPTYRNSNRTLDTSNYGGL